MKAHWVALDVVIDAFARRVMLALFGCILIGLLLLLFALDLDVVEGTLAAGRLFGNPLNGPIVPVDVAMRKLYGGIAYTSFYLGLLFGIIAVSGIAAELFAPGRIELLLSLPVRRAEVVLGTYLGVLAVAVLGTLVAIGGATIILWVKTGFFTLAPTVGAAMAVLAFMAIYALMLLVTTVVRSTVAAAGSGLGFFLLGVATSSREGFLSALNPGLGRTLTEIVLAPVPRFHALAKLGAEIATGASVWTSDHLVFVGITLAFAAACVCAAAFVVSNRDY